MMYVIHITKISPVSFSPEAEEQVDAQEITVGCPFADKSALPNERLPISGNSKYSVSIQPPAHFKNDRERKFADFILTRTRPNDYISSLNSLCTKITKYPELSYETFERAAKKNRTYGASELLKLYSDSNSPNRIAAKKKAYTDRHKAVYIPVYVKQSEKDQLKTIASSLQTTMSSYTRTAIEEELSRQHIPFAFSPLSPSLITHTSDITFVSTDGNVRAAVRIFCTAQDRDNLKEALGKLPAPPKSIGAFAKEALNKKLENEDEKLRFSTLGE